ncbi:suppressor of fused-like protein [Saccoglossus kowalevskii]|uniref:Suppressor of fused homolog n=1 Tax=Saccoglossus kowalevskii TaxID=10224 RepID=D1LXF3_SACKO|nr:suppressor of fused-like protein [Saccoglossus kowalevskii]ACY92659.1 suppressor of fused-like protein [Saccoglossus kowalevskii]
MPATGANSQLPIGLEAIYSSCRKLYQSQPNPLQVTAVVKYWLGGPDPLDYISMYSNPGDPEKGVPPHWHYVSFGISDLHGDGRVHEFTGGEGPSGFGFELTFRLKRESMETAPPTWPAELMQGLSRYVFQSENTLCSGDHVSWHNPLDNSESRINHMLMVEDPQLPPITTPFGSVQFIQIVGVCNEELQTAQHWNGPAVLDLMRKIPVAGGPWLVTDMRRGETIFEIDPHLPEQVDRGIETDGSNLSGVSAKCSWEDWDEFSSDSSGTEQSTPHISKFDSEQIKATLQRGLGQERAVLPPIQPPPSTNNIRHERDTNQDMLDNRKPSLGGSSESDVEGSTMELIRTRSVDGVHLKFNMEAGALIPLALKGRLKHGRHFTFKSITGDVAITLVSPRVEGSIADEKHPFAAHGPWLQILISDDFLEKMIADTEELSKTTEIESPKQFSWPSSHLSITIVPDE